MKRFIDEKTDVKHKLLMVNTQELILFFDNDGKINDCSLCAIKELGYEEDIYQVPIYEIFNEAFHYENSRLEVVEKFTKNPMETVAYCKNQTCFPITLKMDEVYEDKTYLGICTARRISIYKETIHKIKHLENEKRKLNLIGEEALIKITHELKTPANGISGLTNNLLETELNASQKELVELIKSCCNNMNTTINDLLDHAEIESGKLILEQREFSFRKFIRSVVDFNRVRINKKGLKLLVNISNYIPEQLIGDEFRLSQILNNLFSNAVKFTEVGEIVLEIIKTTQTDQYIELFFMIMDTGIGISLSDQDKLFQCFSQVDGTMARRFGGIGLELSICNKLVEAMQGNITVVSEKNKGSTFSFSVRLGVIQTLPGANTATYQDLNLIDIEQRMIADSIDDEMIAQMSSFDHFDKMLKMANIISEDHVNEIHVGRHILEKLPVLLERLVMCIEMEGWDKAEQITKCINKLMPKEHEEVTKHFFCLLLAIRKENRDVSLSMINQIKALINER